MEAIDEARLMEGMQKVANRIALGLVLAALIVGAALLMDVETSFRIFGYPGCETAQRFTGLPVFGAICSRAVRVLIIDDDMDHAESLGYLLKADGHRVETASNPLYALSLVRQFAPEVIFIDIGLPYMDGHKAGEKLRSSFKGVRIYAITGRSDDETRRKSSEVGFDGHLVKPVDYKLIRELLTA